MVRPRALVVHTRTLQAGREFEPSMRFRHLRNFILGSASYLDSAIGMSVADMLAHSPSLAIVIDYSGLLRLRTRHRWHALQNMREYSLCSSGAITSATSTYECQFRVCGARGSSSWPSLIAGSSRGDSTVLKFLEVCLPHLWLPPADRFFPLM
jgi:hypothetical protein